MWCDYWPATKAAVLCLTLQWLRGMEFCFHCCEFSFLNSPLRWVVCSLSSQMNTEIYVTKCYVASYFSKSQKLSKTSFFLPLVWLTPSLRLSFRREVDYTLLFVKMR